MSQETVAAQDMLTRFAEWQGRAPQSLAADTTYGNGEFLAMARRSEHHSLHPDPRQHPPKEESILRPRAFHLRSGTQSLYLSRWPVTQRYGGRVYRNRAFNYIGTRKKCGPCSLRPQCTSAAFRGLIIHQNEPARQRARELANTPEFTKAQRQRKKGGGLVRGTQKSDRIAALAFAETQVRAASSSSWQLSPRTLKRLVRFLSQPTPPVLLATT